MRHKNVSTNTTHKIEIQNKVSCHSYYEDDGEQAMHGELRSIQMENWRFTYVTKVNSTIET